MPLVAPVTTTRSPEMRRSEPSMDPAYPGRREPQSSGRACAGLTASAAAPDPLQRLPKRARTRVSSPIGTPISGSYAASPKRPPARSQRSGSSPPTARKRRLARGPCQVPRSRSSCAPGATAADHRDGNARSEPTSVSVSPCDAATAGWSRSRMSRLAAGLGWRARLIPSPRRTAEVEAVASPPDRSASSRSPSRAPRSDRRRAGRQGVESRRSPHPAANSDGPPPVCQNTTGPSTRPARASAIRPAIPLAL
jgi:hypothetical protein